MESPWMFSWAPEGLGFDSDLACPCCSQASGSDNKARAPGIQGESSGGKTNAPTLERVANDYRVGLVTLAL